MQDDDILRRILKQCIINYSLWNTSESDIEIVYGSTFFLNLYLEKGIKNFKTIMVG